MLTKEKVIKFCQTIMADHTTTCYEIFAEDENYYWAFVFGYIEEEGDCDMIGVKEAYCSRRSAMNEYDMDWIMPFDKNSGEVDDTECFYTITDDVVERIIKDIGCHNHDAVRFIDEYVGKYVEGK